MKTLIKRVLASTLVLISCSYLVPVNAVASSETTRTDGGVHVIVEKTRAEIDQEFATKFEQLQAAFENSRTVRGPQYVYSYDYFDHETSFVEGYAGNQEFSGYRFQGGGGFLYSESGGPSVSFNVDMQLPSPFDFISLSTNLGIRSTSSGIYVPVPNTVDYFLLYVEKELEVAPYAVYRKRSGAANTEWELYSVGGVVVDTYASYYAKKVK